jgi:hypothetical protein
LNAKGFLPNADTVDEAKNPKYQVTWTEKRQKENIFIKKTSHARMLAHCYT